MHILQLDNFFHDDSVEIVACDHNYEGINNQVYYDDVTDNVDNTDEDDNDDDNDNICGERYQGRQQRSVVPSVDIRNVCCLVSRTGRGEEDYEDFCGFDDDDIYIMMQCLSVTKNHHFPLPS